MVSRVVCVCVSGGFGVCVKGGRGGARLCLRKYCGN